MKDTRNFSVPVKGLTVGDLAEFVDRMLAAGVDAGESVMIYAPLFNVPDKLVVVVDADKLPAMVPTPEAEQ